MKKTITSLLLTIAIGIGMLFPAWGFSDTETSNDANTLRDAVFDIEDSESDRMRTVPAEQIRSLCSYNMQNTSLDTEVRAQIANKVPELVRDRDVDFSKAYASARQNHSALSASTSADHTVQIPSVESVRNLRSTVYVSNESELSAALLDQTVDVVFIISCFPLTLPHEITHSVTFISTTPCRVFAPAGQVHFYIQNQSSHISVTFFNWILDGNYTGGGFLVNHSNVTINNAIIQHCGAYGSCTGSAIVARNIAADPVTNELYASGYLTLNAGSFTDNQTNGWGVVDCIGPISMYGTEISNNTGSGVIAYNLTENLMSAQFSHVKIQYNTSTDSRGGGMALYGYSTEISGLTDSYSLITNNTAPYGGGGLYAYMCNTQISNSSFTANTVSFVQPNDRTIEPADVGGGGIMSIGSLSVENSNVENNIGNCDFGFGAGIYALTPEVVLGSNYNAGDYPWLTGEFSVSDSSISGNHCTWATGANPFARYMNGGGIASIGLKPSLESTEITENEALVGGGAVVAYAYDESDLAPTDDPVAHFSGITVDHNIGKMAGGGIVMIGVEAEDDDDVRSSTIKSKLQFEDQSEVTGNHSRFGAGVTVFGVETIVTGGTLIQGNIADSSSYPANASSDLPLWGSAGAGILLVQQSKLMLSNGMILSNTTLKTANQQSAGAGVYAMETCEVVINGAASQVNTNGSGILVSENQIGNTTEGAGINAEKNTSVTISNGQVNENNANSGAGISTRGDLIISGGSVSNNTCTSNGGGILVRDTTPHTVSVTISGGLISGNAASIGAGIRSGAAITMTGGTIKENIASSSGGGIYTVGLLTITAGTIENNSAGLYGGGIFLINSAVIGTNNGSNSSVLIRNNYASREGGGIAARGGAWCTCTLYSGTISGNDAGTNGGGFQCNEPLNIIGGSIYDNGATNNGGGVYNTSSTTMSGGSIVANVAGADGAGIYAVGSLTVTGGLIEGNFADGDGGGIYAAGTTTLSDGTIDLNWASHGGGVYVKGTGTVTNSGCEIEYNNAGYYGGGVCVASGGSYSEVNPPVPGGFCHNNTPDNVYYI